MSRLKLKSKTCVLTAIIAVVALFASSLMLLSANFINSAYAATNYYYFYLGDKSYFDAGGDRTWKIKQGISTFTYTYNYAENYIKCERPAIARSMVNINTDEQISQFIKCVTGTSDKYRLKGWATSLAGEVEKEPNVTLNNPINGWFGGHDITYYAVWGVAPSYDTKVKSDQADKSITITYSDVDKGGARTLTAVVEADLKEETDSTLDNKLNFYKSTLGWSISKEPGNADKHNENASSTNYGTTWFLGAKDGDGKYHNDGLPVLRQFVDWSTYTCKLSVEYYDSNTGDLKTETIEIGRFVVPNNAPVTSGVDIKTGEAPSKDMKNAFKVDMFERLFNYKVREDKDGIMSRFSVKISTSGTTIEVKYIEQQSKPDPIPKRYIITFETPINYDDNTKENKGAYWAKSLDQGNNYELVKDSGGKPTSIKFTSYNPIIECYNVGYYCYRFKAIVNKQEITVIMAFDKDKGGGVTEGYKRKGYSDNKMTYSNDSSKTMIEFEDKGETEPDIYRLRFNNENYQDLTAYVYYDLEYYNYNVGFKNLQGKMNLTVGNAYFARNRQDENETALEMSTILNNNKGFGLNVEGCTLPTFDEVKGMLHYSEVNQDYCNQGTFNGWALNVENLARQYSQKDDAKDLTDKWYKNGTDFWIRFEFESLDPVKVYTTSMSYSKMYRIKKMYGYGDMAVSYATYSAYTPTGGGGIDTLYFKIVPYWTYKSNINFTFKNDVATVGGVDANGSNVQTSIKGVVGPKNIYNELEKLNVSVDSDKLVPYTYNNAFANKENIWDKKTLVYDGVCALLNYGHEIAGYCMKISVDRKYEFGNYQYYYYYDSQRGYCLLRCGNGVNQLVWIENSTITVSNYNSSNLKDLSSSVAGTGEVPVVPIDAFVKLSSNGNVLGSHNSSLIVKKLKECLEAGVFGWYGNKSVIRIEFIPYWEAATIETSMLSGIHLQQNGAQNLDSVKYGEKYSCLITNQNALPAADKEKLKYNDIAYLTCGTKDEDKSNFQYAVMMTTEETGAINWNYLNIPSTCFTYEYNSTDNTGKYKINLEPVYVPKLFKFKIEGAMGMTAGGDYSSGSFDESIVLKDGDIGKYLSYSSFDLPVYEPDKVADFYSYAYVANVKEYLAVLDGEPTDKIGSDSEKVYPSDKCLRKVYNYGGETFIFVAYGHTIGDLYFTAGGTNGRTSIAFLYNGASGSIALKTSKFDETKDQGKLDGKVVCSLVGDEACVWNPAEESFINENNQNPTLAVVVNRSSYVLNVNTLPNDGNRIGFWGYIVVKVTDNDDGGNEDYYVVRAWNRNLLSNEVMYAYLVTDLFNAGKDLSKLSSFGSFDGVASSNSIIVYRNSTVEIMVYDEGKVTNLAENTDYYDSMLGRFYNNGLKGKINGETANIIQNLGYRFSFAINDAEILTGLLAEDVTLKQSDRIELNFEFERKVYELNLGYTIKDGTARNDNVLTSAKYQPNGQDYYQDVIVKEQTKTWYYFPKENAELQAFFGADYEILSNKTAFGGWVVDLTALKKLGYSQKTGKKSWKDAWYLNLRNDQKTYDAVVNFGYSSYDESSTHIQTSSTGKEYLIGVTGVALWNNFTRTYIWTGSEQGLKGYKDSFAMAIIPTWSGNNNVKIINNKAERIVGKGESNENITRLTKGVYDGKNNILVDNLSFSLNYGSATDFIKPTGGAFTQLANVKESNLYNSAGQYGLYNYGHDLTGYKIYFSYGANTYYAKLNKSTNPITGISSYSWEFVNSDSLVKTADLGLNLLSKLMDAFNNWKLGDYVLQQTTITIVPQWSSAQIRLTGESLGEGSKTDIFAYGDSYKIVRTGQESVGKSIAYYTTKSGKAIACDSNDTNINQGLVKWDYLDLDTGDYKYSKSDKTYNVSLTKFEADNIYKLKLENVKGSITGDYSFASTTGLPVNIQQDISNNEYYSYKNWSNASYDTNYAADSYANAVATEVKTYTDGLDNNSNECLRKVYAGENSLFIFAANNHKLGELRFDQPFYENIAWLYNGENGQVAILTSKYQANNDAHKSALDRDDDNIIKLEDNWTIDADESNGNATLYGVFYRETYTLNLNTTLVNEGKQTKGFVGYVCVEVTDNSDGSLSNKYIVKYELGSMKVYKHTGTDSFEFGCLNTIKPENSSNWRIVENNTIDLAFGCDVVIHVFDQSKIEDLTKDNTYYDDMIGYRFKHSLSGKVGNTQVEKGGYGYTIEFNTKTTTSTGVQLKGLLDNPIALKANDKINLDVLFEPIVYSMSIEMTNQNAGNLRISGGNETNNASGVYEKITNTFKRGQTFKIQYWSYAGYGLETNAFNLTNNGTTVNKQKYNGSKGEQTYTIDLSSSKKGAWLRENYYFGFNIPFNVEYNEGETSQFIGDMTVNTCYLAFNVKYKVIDEGNNNELLVDNADILSNPWTLETTSIDWTLTDSYQEGLGYYYNFNGARYAIMKSWAYNPSRGVDFGAWAAEHQYLPKMPTQYEFLLKTKPVQTYEFASSIYPGQNNQTMGSYFLYYLADWTGVSTGEILPESSRTIYFAMSVTPIYEVKLQIAVGVNDTNCSTRTLTLKNGKSNEFTLTANANHSGEQFITAYTHKGLENTISATYNNRYYTGVNFYTGESGETDLDSNPFKAENNETIIAKFAPKELNLAVNYTSNGSAITEAEAKKYFNNYALTIVRGSLNGFENTPKTGFVVTNDRIRIEYSIDFDYQVSILVNGETGRLNANNDIYVTNADYEFGKVDINIDITHKQTGSVSIKVVADSSNGARFHTEDTTLMQSFATLWINGIERGREGIFMEGYAVAIRLGEIPAGYRYVGVKKGDGSVDAKYTLSGNVITITNGIKPQDMDEDTFVKSIMGEYSVVFQKVTIETQMILTARNNNNYSYSFNGVQAVWKNNKLVISNASLNDVINLYSRTSLPNEELDYYFYEDKYGEHRIEGSSLTITQALLDNLAGDYVDGAKTLTLGVKSKFKYTLSVEFEAGAEYLTEIKVKDELMTLTAENTYTSGYEYEDQYLNLKISSVNADKFTIEVYGVKSFSGGTINENIYLFDNIALKAKIVKNTFALTVEEKLFDDIVELNTNNPQTLTTGNLINASVTGSSLIDGTRFEYDSQTQVAFKNTDGEGDNKKQLTQIAFKDENLSFSFDVDFASTENLIDRFQVKDKNNQAVSSGIVASQNGNVVTLKVELDGQTFTYSFELVASNNSIQFNFVGVGNCNLTLIYTAIKLIKVS